MYPEKHLKFPGNLPVVVSPFGVALAAVLAGVLFCTIPSRAQSGSSDQSASPSQSQPTQSQQDQMPAAAGGPTRDSGPIAVPKKNPSEEAPTPPKPKASDNAQYSLHVDVPLVTVDAHVLQKDGRPLNLS